MQRLALFAVLAGAASPVAETPVVHYLEGMTATLCAVSGRPLSGRRLTPVPPEAVEHPERLRVAANGRACFLYGDHGDSRLWVWNGARAFERALSARPAHDGFWLSRDGRRVYWGENVGRYEHEGGITSDPNGIPHAVAMTYRVHSTDLETGADRVIVWRAFPRCRCATSACSETCPEGLLSHGRSWIGDLFFFDHFVPGQIGSRTDATTRVARGEKGWNTEDLPAIAGSILDVDDRRGWIVSALDDGGCCGWVNAGNDILTLRTGGESVVLFDERARYDNGPYDVTFHALRARIAPDLRRVAFTIGSIGNLPDELAAKPGARRAGIVDDVARDPAPAFREGADPFNKKPGRPSDLERLVAAQDALPLVEVVTLTDPPAIADRHVVERAAMAGWLDAKRLLLLRGGTLAAYDVGKRTFREWPIEVRDVRFVFVP